MLLNQTCGVGEAVIIDGGEFVRQQAEAVGIGGGEDVGGDLRLGELLPGIGGQPRRGGVSAAW